MRKWTWQWLVLLGLLGALLSCCAWIDKQPYHIDEEFYKPSEEIGDVHKIISFDRRRTAQGDLGLRIADCGFKIKESGARSQNPELRFQLLFLSFQTPRRWGHKKWRAPTGITFL